MPDAAHQTNSGGASANAAATVATVYQLPVGVGGQGVLAYDVLVALARSGRAVHGLGPAMPDPSRWPADVPRPAWHPAPPAPPDWLRRYTWLRWHEGQYTYLNASRLGRWAAGEVRRIAPGMCYAFTEVALETLRWARAASVPAILDNTTGDIRDYRDVGVREARHWCDESLRVHPSRRMVARVEEEYALADRIRVASAFSKRSMVERGVPAERVHVVPYPLGDLLGRFAYTTREAPRPGSPLRVCFSASLGLHKGFVYLLRAARRFGAPRLRLDLMGATDSRCTRRLLERERVGLEVRAGPVREVARGLHDAELYVLPTLHDGYGFAVAEAMATGLPVIVTDRCGAADLVRPGATGWIVPTAGGPAAFEQALLDALEDAWRRRAELPAMGRAARDDLERRRAEYDGALGRWLHEC
ncbi:MAG TPA: glycosyltransferase family 4 protein [Gemmatimonadaceae bacterium]|nr:glycosyltransferase family 4 protein [Gemmatimonadaceae bacterium]